MTDRDIQLNMLLADVREGKHLHAEGIIPTYKHFYAIEQYANAFTNGRSRVISGLLGLILVVVIPNDGYAVGRVLDFQDDLKANLKKAGIRLRRVEVISQSMADERAKKWGI